MARLPQVAAGAVQATGSSAGPKKLTVTVAVLTFRRPVDLRHALPQLVEQIAAVNSACAGRVSAGILVVDNDPDASARTVVTGSGDGLLRYVVEPEPGISAARNRALDSADSDLVVFIDDDERPYDGWLSHLLSTWEKTKAAAVSGRVVAEYEGELDPWIDAGRFFVRRRLTTGTELDVAAAGNLLLDLNQVRALGVRFAAEFGLTGGEDTHFSRTLVKRGGRMVWCDESAVTDVVPRSRMTRRWVLRRAFSHGNSSALITTRLADGSVDALVSRSRSVMAGGARCCVGGFRFAWGLVFCSPRHQARGMRSLFRGLGMLAGAAGFVFSEYARDGDGPRLSRFKQGASVTPRPTPPSGPGPSLYPIPPRMSTALIRTCWRASRR